MDIILPPIQGTTFVTQSPPFSSMGVLDSFVPLCPEASSRFGTRFAFSTK